MGAEKLAPTNYHHVNLHDDFFMPGNGFAATGQMHCMV